MSKITETVSKIFGGPMKNPFTSPESLRSITRALTLQQPWPWFITAGHLQLINHTYATNFRGPIAIHSGGASIEVSDASIREFSAAGIRFPDGGIGSAGLDYKNAIVGVACIVDVVPVQDLLGHPSARFAHGPYCWLLDHVHTITPSPIPCHGRFVLGGELWSAAGEWDGVQNKNIQPVKRRD